MASPGKKPRDIKNLKARLGRTITPGQAGVPTPGVGSIPPGTVPTPAPGAVPAPGAMPTPAAGALPTPAPGSIPAPGVAPAGLPGAIAAPPFAQPAAPQPAAAATPSQRPRDPFAAAAPSAVPTGGGKVTLVIDDSKVDNSEVGRGSKRGSLMALGVGAVLGIVLTFGVLSTKNERDQFNLAVRDGKEIYAKVQEVSKSLDTAKSHVKSAVAKSQPGANNTAAVSYSDIEALVALERPFTANEFHRRRYMAFPSNVVDDLFDYYNNMNVLWDRFATLGARTAGKQKREALDESAKATDGLIKTQYGTVMFKQGDAFAVGIVYVAPPEAPPEEGQAPVLQVSSSPGGRSVDRTLYLGQEDLVENYGNYVMMVDKMRSGGVLGEPTKLFSTYTGLLMEVNAILSKTSEIQGRLIKELGKVAALDERSFF